MKLADETDPACGSAGPATCASAWARARVEPIVPPDASLGAMLRPALRKAFALPASSPSTFATTLAKLR